MKSLFPPSTRPWHLDAAGALILVILGVTWYMVLARPLLTERKIAKQQRVELQGRQAKLTRTLAARKDTGARLAAVRADVESQSVRLEPRSRVNERLKRLTDLAEASGIRVEKLSPGPTADGPRHGTMSVRFTGRAEYDKCAAFLAGLHDSFKDTAITTLRMAANPETTGPVTVELELLWFTAPDATGQQR